MYAINVSFLQLTVPYKDLHTRMETFYMLYFNCCAAVDSRILAGICGGMLSYSISMPVYDLYVTSCRTLSCTSPCMLPCMLFYSLPFLLTCLLLALPCTMSSCPVRLCWFALHVALQVALYVAGCNSQCLRPAGSLDVALHVAGCDSQCLRPAGLLPLLTLSCSLQALADSQCLRAAGSLAVADVVLLVAGSCWISVFTSNWLVGRCWRCPARCRLWLSVLTTSWFVGRCWRHVRTLSPLLAVQTLYSQPVGHWRDADHHCSTTTRRHDADGNGADAADASVDPTDAHAAAPPTKMLKSPLTHGIPLDHRHHSGCCCCCCCYCCPVIGDYADVAAAAALLLVILLLPLQLLLPRFCWELCCCCCFFLLAVVKMMLLQLLLLLLLILLLFSCY